MKSNMEENDGLGVKHTFILSVDQRAMLEMVKPESEDGEIIKAAISNWNEMLDITKEDVVYLGDDGCVVRAERFAVSGSGI